MNSETSANHAHTGFSKPEQHRYRSNSYDVSHTKRMRTGSISGRLRTASNLEELGYIDKKQKGLIKDLIISGDTMLQSLLDKYERGDGKELLDLINQGYLGRKESIDLLEGLDFDFLNGFKSDEEGDGQKHDEFDNFDFSWNDPSAGHGPPPPHHIPNNSHQNSFAHTKIAPSVPVPPPIIINSSHSAPSLMPPPSSVRSPTGSKISPPPTALTIAGQPYTKPRTLSEVAMDFMEKRKESFDAVNISEMIFDDLIGSGTANHSSGTDTDLGLFEDLLYDPSNPQHRRASRLDSFADAFAHHQFGEFGGSADDVDLSAYATLAQSLQNNKNKLPPGNSGLAKDPKLNLKIKLEGNKSNGGKPNLLPHSHDASQKAKMNKGILLPTTTISTFGMNNLSMSNANLHNATGFPSSSSVATPAMVNNISLKTKNEPGNVSPSSDLRRTLGFTGSLSTPSSLPGQKPIVTTSGFIGAYTPDQRKLRIERFLEKRTRRVWTRKVKYDVRKNFADSRLRIKGRFVKKEDEDMMRELMSL
eukprot:gene8295-8972_t